mgnify:FL=1
MENNNLVTLRQKAKLLPSTPGVYFMRDSFGRIIYIGKAKSLRNRVAQYFTKQNHREPKVEEMIQRIADFDYRVLDTELEALLEECRLIKELKPFYNRQMKNDQKYVYLKIPHEKYPKLEIVQQKEEDGAVYYGPFKSRHQVERAVEYCKDLFKLRKCSVPGLPKSREGCFYKQLGTCFGVCTGKVSPEEYQVYVQALCQVIEGKDKREIKKLQSRLEQAVSELKFEEAARYREYLQGVTYVQERQKFLSSSRRIRSFLVIESFESLPEDMSKVKVFLISGNKLLLSKIINLPEHIHSGEKPQSQAPLTKELETFLVGVQERLTCILAESRGSFRSISQQEVDEAQIVYSFLRRKNMLHYFFISQKALKQKSFVEDYKTVLLKILSEWQMKESKI